MSNYKGRPFIADKNTKLCVGTTVNSDGSVNFCYTTMDEKEESRYYMGTILEKDIEEMFNNQIFAYVPIYAKVNTVVRSAGYFGNTSRKKEFIGSVLKIIEFSETEDGSPYLVLETGRIEGTLIRIFTGELDLMLPTISIAGKQKKKNKFFAGDNIVAIKDEPCRMFSSGDKFTIIDITINSATEANNILSIKGVDDVEYVTYAKYFKKAK